MFGAGWTFGLVVSNFIGGVFSHPEKLGIYVFEGYPFALPFLICSLIALCMLIVVCITIKDTYIV
jgi:hypothetical protein